MSTLAHPDTPTPAPAPTLSLSVVICAYTTRRWDDLCDSVNSALAKDVPAPPQVVVVIDHND
ncbi:MAG: hypothetical protein AB7S95_34510, partial [Mycolicibacterium sp.]